MTRIEGRDLALAGFAGAISACAWVAAWGLAVAYLWIPFFQEHGRFLGGGDPHAARIYAGIFDVVVAAILALLTCVPLSYLSRGRRSTAWFIFIAALLTCQIISSAIDGALSHFLTFLLSHPMVWAFIAASAFACWFGGVLRGKHVQV